MGQITLRLPDEQEQHLKNLAKEKRMTLAQYIRDLLDLGVQIEMASDGNSATNYPEMKNTPLQILYLMRYLVNRLFKDEGRQACKVARRQAAEDINSL